MFRFRYISVDHLVDISVFYLVNNVVEEGEKCASGFLAELIPTQGKLGLI